MRVLDNLEPARVFHYFEDICEIPHGSGNIKKISDYLCSFAREHGLKYIQDSVGNVIIYKNAAIGYEDMPGIVIQGHMDMVAVAEAGCTKNLAEEGLSLIIDGDYITADKTSLGGDDGIAVAYALAILESDLPHPALEVVITVDEEVGMDGAAAIDGRLIKGRQFLNLDNEVEGQIITGCAGGARVSISVPYDVVCVDDSDKKNWIYVKLSVSGGLGGHSGIEIDKGRVNANILVGKLYAKLIKKMGDKVSFAGVNGGVADNAIPAESSLTIAVWTQDKEEIFGLIKDIWESEYQPYKQADPNVVINIEEKEELVDIILSDSDSNIIASIFEELPNGIQAMSKDVEGLVETSLNLGRIYTNYSENNERCLMLQYAVRSSVDEDKRKLIDNMRQIVNRISSTVNVDVAGVYPGWKYRSDSPFRDMCIDIFEKMYGHVPEVEAIHAGLECGFFAEKLDGLDCISMGPNMHDIHSPRERLSISSTQRTWEYVCRILANK